MKSLTATESDVAAWRKSVRDATAQAEPVAYRFTENRGNGKTEYSYYSPEQLAIAYRDNCLEITPLYATPPAPREPTPKMIAAGADEIRDQLGVERMNRIFALQIAEETFRAMIAAQEKK